MIFIKACNLHDRAAGGWLKNHHHGEKETQRDFTNNGGKKNLCYSLWNLYLTSYSPCYYFPQHIKVKLSNHLRLLTGLFI
jgi:hypothetical protein